jgi:hypothetical protein
MSERVRRPTSTSPQTNLGIGLWGWVPLMQIEDARCFKLWMGLFSTPEAKRWPPGLWLGGPAVMAEAASMGHGDVVAALRTLRDVNLVEYDERSRVARLVALPPDKPEGTRSGSVVWSWWKRFGAVPPCAVRDAHVLTLRWLADQTSPDVSKAWAETFGTMPTPLPGPRPIGPRGEGPGEGPRQGVGEGGRETPRQGPPLPQSDLFPSSNFNITEGEGVPHPPRDPGGEGQEEGRGLRVKEGEGECEREVANVAHLGADMVDAVARAMARFGPSPAAPPHPDLARRRR